MIEFQGLHKTFGSNHVLKGVSGVLEAGKVNLILGGSGTGKSVLLKCLVGLLQPDDGAVLYNGRSFHESNVTEKKAIRREIGMLFQGSALFDSKTVEQNVMFPLDMLSNMEKGEKIDRVNFCLERVGLAGKNDLMPSEISGGMQKRVGIARAIVANSKYLFCDEPNSGLDPRTAILIDDLIKEITYEYNITTTVVTHDMNSVLGIGDKILYFQAGEKLWEGTRHEIYDAKVKEFNDFIFANIAMQELKNRN